jgi:hypothetical protein
MEAHGGEVVRSYSYLTSELDGSEWPASRPGRALPPGKGPPVPIVQEAGWAPEPVWTQRLEEKSSAPVGDRTPIVHPVFHSSLNTTAELVTYLSNTNTKAFNLSVPCFFSIFFFPLFILVFLHLLSLFYWVSLFSWLFSTSRSGLSVVFLVSFILFFSLFLVRLYYSLSFFFTVSFLLGNVRCTENCY